jgi:Family of unknown function (DUF5947)
MSAGLRRFLAPASGRAAGPPGAEADQAGSPRPGLERCELCAAPVGDGHDHVVDTTGRSVLCACRPCYLLFTHTGAGNGRYRSVPERHLHDPGFELSEAQWDALQIPVGVAFIFRNSSLDRMVALYPSPAGATESLLPTDTWDEVLRANPLLAEAEPDVEALLLRRHAGAFECYLVPIAACYELVALVRLQWHGFEGGTEAWDAIGAFFDQVKAKCRVVERAAEGGEGGRS